MSLENNIKFNYILTSDFCSKVTDGTHDTPKEVEFGKKLVTSKNILGGKLNLDNSYYISIDDFNKINERSKVDKWDLLLYMIGVGVGEVALIKEEPDFAIKNLGLLKNENETNAKWLYYYLRSPEGQYQIKTRVQGSTQPYIPLKELKKLEIPIPNDDAYLKYCIGVLDNIDKKIEINEKINKNLYQIIELRFKNYVGDFSNLDTVVLSDYCKEIIRGFNSKYVEKSNLINLNQKVNKGDVLEKQHFKYLDESISVPKEKFARKKDVLLNSLGDGTLGRVHYYNDNTDNVVIDQHITIIRSDENKLPSSYIYQYLKCGAGQYHLDSLIAGSTGMLMLNISNIRNLEMPILPKEQLFEFDKFASVLFDKISINSKEIETLSKLRDTLLPKLMSGEIDVSKINCDLE